MRSATRSCDYVPMQTESDTVALLRALSEHDVRFIVVGMTAGVLQGAPAVTFDLDILYAPEADNLDNLLSALLQLDARFRGDPRRIAPNISHLESKGHKLLETKHGDLDVLGTVDDVVEYDELYPHTVEISEEGLSIRVVELSRLIEIKRRAGRDKDLAVLPLLESTLARIRKQD